MLNEQLAEELLKNNFKKLKSGKDTHSGYVINK